MLTKAQAAAEILLRRRAQSSLIDFVKVIDVPGSPTAGVGANDDNVDWLFEPVESGLSAHHLLMCKKIQECMTKPFGRLMLFLPPGSAKSTYASVVAPAWYMGGAAGRKVILACYASDLARRQGRRARSVVRQKRYKSIFNADLSGETSAMDDWELTNGSAFLAGGINSGITGNRAHGLLIDDPVAGREDADSETMQKKTLASYQDDLKTRLLPGAWIVIVQTRWNEKDLAGCILPADYDGQSGQVLCRDGQMWEILSIPAQAERDDDPLGRQKGEMLWPEWFTEQHWAQFRSNARTWASLYQQRPRPDGGGFFDIGKIHRGTIAPKNLVIIAGSDLATTNDGGDFTEHGIVGVDENGSWHVLDWYYGQKSSDVWIAKKIEMIKQRKPVIWFDEAGPIHSATVPLLERQMIKKSAHCWLEKLSSLHGKTVRAEGLRGMVAMGMIHIPNTEWGNRIVDQMQVFPAGAFDDAVDVLSLIARGQTLFNDAIIATKPKPSLPQLPVGHVRVSDLEDSAEPVRSRYKF